jgi:hypothetical protein
VHVALTADLDRSPADVVARVCEHIGVEPHQPEHIGERFYPGGERLVPVEAEQDLNAYLGRHVWPHTRRPKQHREAFEFWFRLWNAKPLGPTPAVDEHAAAALREHFAPDAALLETALGVRVPWAAG